MTKTLQKDMLTKCETVKSNVFQDKLKEIKKSIEAMKE